MIRYREIMRLHSLGQPAESVAAAAGCSRRTVGNVLRAAKKAGLEWPLPEDIGDEAIRRLIYPSKYARRADYAEPDYQWVHDQLKRKGVTRALLYEEYRDGCRAAGKEPCCATTFNSGYEEWASMQNVTMHVARKPGQKMEVDWAPAASRSQATPSRSRSSCSPSR